MKYIENNHRPIYLQHFLNGPEQKLTCKEKQQN